MTTASIVTYNHNVLDIEAILRSLASSPVQRVWIVDHSDTLKSLKQELDNFMQTVDMIKAADKGFSLEYIKHKNNGYGGGHNVAIRKALEMGSKYHLVVNPDVWFGQEVIPALTDYMDHHPEVGQMMPQVIYLDGSIQKLAKQLPTPFDIFGRFFLPDFMIRERNSRFELCHSDYKMTLDVPYLSGCFMFFRTEALQNVGLFDEHFFMYAEDIDMTRRIHAHYQTIFYPTVSIFHKFNRASHRSLRLFWIHSVNMLLYFNKWGWWHDAQRDEFNKRVLADIDAQMA